MLLKIDGAKVPIKYPGLLPNEYVDCSNRSCPLSYALVYGQVEVHRPDSSIDLMRRKAIELISNYHPHPSGRHELYLWSEHERRWLDEESAEHPELKEDAVEQLN